tara:strand:+ start:1448 stop:1792 length:345 start_codon:yes stop_codon:yes gene_type:complete
MLIDNKKYDVGDIVALKTIAGEEIITMVEEEFALSDSNDIIVSRPMRLVAQPDGVAMMPYLISINMVVGINEKIRLSRHNLVVIFTPVKDVKTAYMQSRSNLDLGAVEPGIISG